MPTTIEQITKRIKQIRKSKRIKIHDCASILGFPKETYLGIEEGITPITLPELELLAIYFGVDPSVFFDFGHLDILYPTLLNDDIRSKFIILREKMIRAALAEARKKKNLTLEDIQKETDIPFAILQEYDNGNFPIPLNDLIKIGDYVNIPINMLLYPDWAQSAPHHENQNLGDWHPEFNKITTQEVLSDNEPYENLINALKKLPNEDQAQIAKFLFEKLKSLKSN